MISVMFVDDEPDLLSALSRMLRSRRNVWSMQFVTSASAALGLLDERRVDVVDMLMPGIDGASFLATVRRRFPATVRIVLSGQTQHGRAARDVIEAHQFLAKPCRAEQLVGAVERSLLLQDRLHDPDLFAAIGGLSCLPSPSPMVAALRDELGADVVDLSAVGALIRSDVAVSAKVLQFVNSVFFGLPRSLSDLSEAVMYLGTRALGELVMSAAVFRSLEERVPGSADEVERFQQRSVARAELVVELAMLGGRAASACRDLWTSDFLADVGDLLLMTTDIDGDGWHAADVRRRLGASVGAHLMSVWGLPHHMIETAALGREFPTEPVADGPSFAWLARTVMTSCRPNDAEHGDDVAAQPTGACTTCILDVVLAMLGLSRPSLVHLCARIAPETSSEHAAPVGSGRHAG